MDAGRYQQVKSLLADALERRGADRTAFLDHACGDDAALRAEVESLLEYEADEMFLEPEVAVPLDAGGDDPGTVSGSADPFIGRTIASYQVLERLGAGGMGVVYLAEDTRLGRRAALKFLAPELKVSREAETRFVREARAGASLDHPNICTLYGIEHTPEGQICLVMAYYEGETLKQRLKQGVIDVLDAIDIARQTGAGLAAAHDVGIVHRDVKPGNIMLTGGRVKILDFGIAKLADQVALTLPGAALGTAAYVSPEQALGGKVDHRTDVWSLGVVTYEMLAGVRPFDVDRVTDLPNAARSKPAIALRKLRPEISGALDAAVMRALARHPEQRYNSIREFVDALGTAAPKPRTRSNGAAPAASLALAAPDHHSDVATHPAMLAAFEEAIAAAPRDPRPRAVVVLRCLEILLTNGLVDDRDLPQLARDELRRAQRLDAGCADVQWAAAELAFLLDRAPEAAKSALRHVVAVRPAEVRPWLVLAECLVATGDAAEACVAAREAAQRAAGSPHVLRRAGRILHYAGDYAAAARLQRAALDLVPDAAAARLDLALTLAKQNDLPGAAAECDRALVWQDGHAVIAAAVGSAARARGDTLTHAAAGQYLRGLERRAPVPPACYQLLDAAFGETGRPLEYLERFVEPPGLAKFIGLRLIAGSASRLVETLGLIVYLGIDPAFDVVYRCASVQQLLEMIARRAGQLHDRQD